MMQNTWLLADMAECQREDAMDRAEQYRLCQMITTSAKIRVWAHRVVMLLIGLVAVVMTPRG